MTTGIIPGREAALSLFLKYNKSDSLLKHALSVEGVMKYMARKEGEDEEKWGTIGLLHDIDYEMYPEEHCSKARDILTREGWPEDYIRAVISHGWGICSDVEPSHKMEKILFATDELTGLVTAAALVRPSKSVLDITVKSVKKKWKVKAFAAGVDRDIILKGAEMMGVEIAELIQDVIDGMKDVAQEIGLAGEPL
ncbi:MAG: HDIG domain-containing protein [Spirochaetales bacterium]|nr:HDIG domain-containing protein [Spirochaetales bacterium]